MYGEGHYTATYKAIKYSPYAQYIPLFTHYKSVDEFATYVATKTQFAPDFNPAYAYFSPHKDNTQYHFRDLTTARITVDIAIMTHNPKAFAITLHTLQDWYAHWLEGYRSGHQIHTQRAWRRNLDIDLQDDFFKGFHYEYHDALYQVASPVPSHPKEEVQRNVGLRNLGINVLTLSDGDLIDLYLRSDLPGSDPSRDIWKERNHFGFDTDKYIEGSKRDRLMYEETAKYVDKFLIVYLVHRCEQ